MAKKYERVVVLTGAGISQESGLKTFRGSDGLWEGHRVEDVCTPEAFRSNPELVYEFYNARRCALSDERIVPNAAHLALAKFEKRFAGDFLIVTQNVDDLHERAGSQNILHMHGELLKVRGVSDGHILDWPEDLTADSRSLETGDQTLRPHIVWFGEMPLFMDQIQDALARCDLFVSIGTSGLVYPAANFVNWLPRSADSVELNLDDTPKSNAFKKSLRGKASEIVVEFFSTLS